MLTRFIFAALLAIPVSASAQSLSEAVQRAWERAGLDQVASAGQQDAAAASAVADAWFAAAPSLGLAQRDDRFNRDRGLRERELELALPLWRPGQRSAAQAVAAVTASEVAATLAERRLALAGEVRIQAWRLVAARAEANVRAIRLASAEQIESDVARRVAAGDMARSDLLLTKAELMTVRAEHLTATSRVQQALQAWRGLTGLIGLDEFSDPARESPAADRTQAYSIAHPQQVLADAVVARARAELDLARDSGPAPELSLGWQQARESAGANANNSLRIGLRLPLAGETRSGPRIAAANLALVRAETDRQRLAFELEGRELEAQLALESARQTLQLAEGRGHATAERRRLLQRAFDLGELALSELLRAQTLDNEAQLQLALARIELGLRQSVLNQARGVLP